MEPLGIWIAAVPAASLKMETRLRTHMDALRVLARLNDLNQVILVERNIDEFLQTNADQLAHALERLSNAIRAEERANRSREDWSIARDYVRRLLHRMLAKSGRPNKPARRSWFPAYSGGKDGKGSNAVNESGWWTAK